MYSLQLHMGTDAIWYDGEMEPCGHNVWRKGEGLTCHKVGNGVVVTKP